MKDQVRLVSKPLVGNNKHERLLTQTKQNLNYLVTPVFTLLSLLHTVGTCQPRVQLLSVIAVTILR